MIAMIIKVKIDPANAETFEDLMRECRALVDANEPSTLAYHLNRSPGEPGVYKAFEIYESEEAMKIHASGEGFKVLAPAVMELMLEPPVTERLVSIF